jgi:hypothetical protein
MEAGIKGRSANSSYPHLHLRGTGNRFLKGSLVTHAY